MSPAAPAPSFAESDFDNSAVGRPRRGIGFATARQRWGLAISISVPLVALWLATSHEGRFHLGSVLLDGTIAGKTYRLLGMSFLGDPMVWGFTILVPLLIATLNLARHRTLKLLNTAALKATVEWRNDSSSTGFEAAVLQTKRIWTIRSSTGFGRFPLRVLPWAAAIAICSYNAIACDADFRALFSLVGNPYSSDHVTLVVTEAGRLVPAKKSASEHAPHDGKVNDEMLLIDYRGKRIVGRAAPKLTRRSVELTQKVPLTKWDCERKVAPWSFWLTRVWSLFFYGAVPFLVWELSLLVWGATSFLGAGRRWEHQSSNPMPALKVNPYELDGFGGLGALSDAVLVYLYCVSMGAALLGLSFAKEGIEPAGHNYALMIVFLPIGVWVVLAPALAVRHTIVGPKDRYLQVLGEHLHQLAHDVLSAVQRGTLAADLEAKKLEAQKEAIRGLYEDVARMKEWPFDTLLITRVVFSLAAPWLPAAVKEIIAAGGL